MKSSEPQTPVSASPEALQRLRDRTDELELIISSLTIFALFSLPGWLFESYSKVFTHLSDSMVIAGTLGVPLITGVSYGLAACFLVHLMARAYWVGLIGLRTVFPEGINWNKTPGIGPVSRQYFKSTLPNLETVIQRTDRVASSLFAVISLITMAVLWFGAIMLVTLITAVQIGSRFGLTNASIGIGAILLVIVFAGLPAILWLMDAQLAKYFTGLQNSRMFVGSVKLLRRISGIVYPHRLILPVQLTLQSNTRPIVFYLALLISAVVIVIVGNARFVAWQNFSLSNEFTYLEADIAANGYRSTYYEDMSSPEDRFRAWPRISSFSQTGSFVTLFLPYQPLRDNLILDQFCTDANDQASRLDCLRKLWSVSINDQLVPMADFGTAERMDIRMRGLIGIVPLNGLSPGLQHIRVVWNPSADATDKPVDDRYNNINQTFNIPFVLTPGVEMELTNIE